MSEEKTRLTVDFPTRMYQAIAREAKANGDTITALARRGILEEMDKVRVKRIRRETAPRIAYGSDGS